MKQESFTQSFTVKHTLLTPVPKGVRAQPKLDEACLRLELLTADLPPGARLPKVTELCRELSVSVVTLDKALARLEREGVLRRVHGLGIFAAPRAEMCIALLADLRYFRGAQHSPFWDLILERAQERAQLHHEEIHLHLVSPLQRGGLPLAEGLVKEIEERQIHGVLGVGLQDEVANWLTASGIPFVHFAGKGDWIVGMQGYEVVQLGARELVERGCKRIGYWSGRALDHSVESSRLSMQEHVVSLQTTLSELSADFDPALVSSTHDDSPLREWTMQEQGYQLARRVLSQPRSQWPDGVITSNDMMTYGALKAMDALQVRPGRDLHIATPANAGSSVLAGHESELIRAEFDPKEIISVAFQMLELLMAGQTPSENLVFVQPKLRAPRALL